VTAVDDGVELLDWDSGHFGCRIARLREPGDPERIRAAIDHADRSGIRCLTALIDAGRTEAVSSAEDAGFHCYDVRVELEREVESAEEGSAGLRHASAADLRHLEPLARVSFSDSRFYADPNFPDDLVDELYVAWLRRGFEDDDRVLLTTADLAGFIVCHLDRQESLGAIELIAVAGESAGLGHGGRLVRAAEASFAGVGLARARVVTQGRNVPAQRLYQRHGYRSDAVGFWMHRWAPQA
jgi:dTDP-4-amino-4,6-dideoxy-D-galactose acyltransferase